VVGINPFLKKDQPVTAARWMLVETSQNGLVIYKQNL